MADFFKQKIRAIVPTVYFCLSYLLFKSCRIQRKGIPLEQYLLENQPVIFSFWHYSLLFIFYNIRSLKSGVMAVTSAMVSSSEDGDYIARLVEKHGFRAIRGSANRHGVKALKKMLTHMRDGDNCALVADGSQGPVFKVQAGVILLASKTGRPILPVVSAASRYINIKSWDRTVVPMPFSQIVMYYGEPFYVPAKLRSDGLEEYRLRLEVQLNDLYLKAWNEFGKECHFDNTEVKEKSV